MSEIKRGDIWWVENGKIIGSSKQSGNRPAIVVSNDIGNNCAPIVEIVWLTRANKKDMPTHVKIRNFGTAICEQIHTISKDQLAERESRCTEKEMLQINKAMLVSLGIIF